MGTAEELTTYIEKSREKNLSGKEIKNNLLGAGWSADQVENALGAKTESEVPIPKPPNSQSQKADEAVKTGEIGMWDAFEHTLLFISLFVFSVAFGQTIHTFIDVLTIPHTDSFRGASGFIADPYSAVMFSVNQSLLRLYLAMLIVSFPFFAFLFLRITKRTKKHPELRRLKLRKLLIYLTLIISFLLMLGNFVRLVYGFLSGNVTFNFLMHFVNTVSITAVISIYYIYQVKEDRKINA